MTYADTSIQVYQNKIVPQKAILQKLCMEAFEEFDDWGATADQIADKLGLDEFSIRPRITELYQMGKIELMSARRKNSKGNSCRVYRLNSENTFLTTDKTNPNG